MAAPSHARLDDPERLSVLRATGLLDSPPSAVLERLTRTTTRVLGVPVALVSLVDDERSYFAGQTGLPGWAAERRQVPLTHSLSRHVVTTRVPLVVADMTRHPLAGESRAVVDLGLRAYAGVPLTTAAGATLGAFCAIDTAPRAWTARELDTLDDLALAAMADIEWRVRHRLQADVGTRVREACEGVGALVWTVDVRADGGWHHGRLLEHLGYPVGLGAGPEHAAWWCGRVHPGDQPACAARAAALGSGTGVQPPVEYRFRRADGTYATLASHRRVIRDDAGHPLRAVGVELDVSARAAADRARRASETRFRAFVEQALDTVLVLDAEGTIRYVSPAVRGMLGYDPAALHGTSAFPLVAGDDVERVGHALGRVVRHPGHEERLEVRARHADGGWRVIEAIGRVLPAHALADDATPEVLVTLRDMTAHRTAEAARHESEERYRLVSLATNDVVWDWNLVTNELRWNDAVAPVFRYAPGEVAHTVAWRNARLHAEDAARVLEGIQASITGGATGWSDEYRFLRGDGTYAVVLNRGYVARDADGTPVRMIGAMLDLTQQRSLEAQLRQAQKMEAVGQLAGGVAHDFNNLLTVIQGNLQFVREDLPADHPVRPDLKEIGDAAERARTLVRQLLTFSRKQPVLPQRVRVGELVTGTERLLRRVIGEEIVLEVALEAPNAVVLADAGQLEQVLMNLAVNARDAMLTPRHGHPGTGGTLVIEVDAVELTAAEARSWQGVGPGRWVRLRVRDTGHGMDAATHAHVFEPFFTTKSVGAGTGLGLATVFGIVRQAGGAVWVDSAPGRGTTFTILLPAADPVDAEAAPYEAEPAASVARATILLVEDETPVRVTACRILTRRGYQVLEARHGADALLLWQTHRAGVDAVVTDLRMPEMGGRELVARLQADAPTLPVVCMSGYPDQQATPIQGSCSAFVEKPFTADTLLTALGRVLQAAPSPASD